MSDGMASSSISKNAFFALLVLVILVASAVSSVSALVNPSSMFGGCVIVNDKGGLQDSDCDRTPDQVDNCPLLANPDQSDVDDNGVGDACDLVIEEIRIEPEQPVQGRSMLVTTAVVNNRAYPMRNLVLKVDVPRLGLSQNIDLDTLQPGARTRKEFVLRVPECAPTRSTAVAVIAEYPFAVGQQEVFSQSVNVPIQSGGTCSKDPAVESDKTFIEIGEVQDIDPVNGAMYPFTIHNTWSESKAYVLYVDGVQEWGEAQVQPGPLIIVPAGQTREGALQVWAKPGVTGTRSFALTVQAKDDVKQVMLVATVPETTTAPQSARVHPFIIFLLIVLAAAVVAAIIIFFSRKE
jgi:hypothetical protein